MKPWNDPNRLIHTLFMLILGLAIALGWSSQFILPAQGKLQASAQVQSNSFSMHASRPLPPTVTRSNPPPRQPSMIRTLPSMALPTATRSVTIGIPIRSSLPNEARTLGQPNVSPTPMNRVLPPASVGLTTTPIAAIRTVTPTVTMTRTATH